MLRKPKTHCLELPIATPNVSSLAADFERVEGKGRRLRQRGATWDGAKEIRKRVLSPDLLRTSD